MQPDAAPTRSQRRPSRVAASRWIGRRCGSSGAASVHPRWLQTLQRVLILLDQSLLFWTVTVQELSLKTQRVPTWKSNRPCWNSWCEFCIGVNVLLVLIFWPDFYFSPYILFLLFLVSKPINAWYLIPYRHPTNRKCWCGWRYSKIIIKKSILTLKNCHVCI